MKCQSCGLSECINAPVGPLDILPATRQLVQAVLRADAWVDYPTESDILDYAATNGGQASTKQARLNTLSRAVANYRAAIKEAV